MSTSYIPVFLWLPTRLMNGSWAWLRKVQRVSSNGPYGRTHAYRDYLTSKTRAAQSDLLAARATLSRFTPERPMIVGPAVYAAMKAQPGLADMMDRVVLRKPLPKARGPIMVMGDGKPATWWRVLWGRLCLAFSFPKDPT